VAWIDTVMLWFLFGSVAATGIFLIVYFFVYNIKVRVRIKTQSYDYVLDKRGRLAKDREDGVNKLHIFMFKVKRMPAPPQEAVGISKKGKQVIEVEVNEEGLSRYIIKNTATKRFEAWNSNDQQFYINEQKKADARKKKTLADIILQLAPIFAITIMFVCLLIFWKDVMQPFTSRMDASEAFQLEISEKQLEITTMLKEIIKQEQIISTVEGELITVGDVQTPPPAPPKD